MTKPIAHTLVHARLRGVTRVALSLTLALLATACGGRSDLPGGAGAETGPAGPHREHIYVAESDTWGNDPRILRFDDMKGTNWTTYRPSVSSPCNLVVDDVDRVYFTASDPPAIVRIDDMLGGGLQTFVDPGVDEGQIAAPAGVALDAQGRLYVTDAVAHRVVRMDDLSGAGWAAIGGPNAGSGFAQFNEPGGITVAADGTILVSDGRNGRIVQMDDISGAGWRDLPIPHAAGEVALPLGVSFDASGRLYVAEFWSSTLHRYDSIEGDGHATFNSTSTVQLSHVFVHPSGRIYLGMLNAANAVAVMDDFAGTGLTLLGTYGAGEKQFRNPCGIHVR